MKVELNPVRIYRKYRTRQQAVRLTRIAHEYNFEGYKRLYLFHARKTAGTTIAKIFMSATGCDGGQLYEQLCEATDRQFLSQDSIFVGWDKRLIESGEYYFGFSHIPFDDLSLPEQTFRFTVLRDPVQRVLSHYRMLLDFSKQDDPHESFAEEKHWLGNSFEDFLDRIPREHLQNQLFMFSKKFDPDEAASRVLDLEHVILFEQLEHGLCRLENLVGKPLSIRHDRKGQSQFEISQQDHDKLKQMLEPECKFYATVAKQIEQA